MSVPEDLAKGGYVVYEKTTEGIPWWAKALLIGGLGAGAIYGIYYVINKFVNPSPIAPPNQQQLINMKQQSYQNWLQTYDNFTQHGTKALTQDQINTLNTIQDQITYYNNLLLEYYKAELGAQEALHSGIENAAIIIVGMILATYTGVKLGSQALSQWFQRKGGGGQNITPDDMLGQSINTAFTKTPKGQENNSAQALTATELTIGVELLSYGYQLAGYTSNAINILNAYIPIATAQYNSITNTMALVSNLYASGQLTQTDFVNMQLTLNVSLVATYALLVYYSIEGFAITVSSWVINAVNTIAANALIAAIAAIGILTAFAIYYFGPEIAEIVGQIITKIPA
jgi:hypothetical protein